jgi:hypothetical protein
MTGAFTESINENNFYSTGYLRFISGELSVKNAERFMEPQLLPME